MKYFRTSPQAADEFRRGIHPNATTSSGLLELHPEHCLVEGVQVYTVGIACEKIRSAAESR